MSVDVVRVSTESDDEGFYATIYVRRSGYIAPVTKPQAKDLPPDIRLALKQWLARAEEER